MRQPADNPSSLPLQHTHCKQPRGNAQSIHHNGVAIDLVSSDVQCTLHSEVSCVGEGQQQAQQSLKVEDVGEGEGGG